MEARTRRNVPMANKPVRLIAIAAVIVLCSAEANPDWKYFDAGKFGAVPIFSFYDSATIRRPAPDHVQVWTKGLKQDAANNAQLSDKELDDAAARVLKGYKPPVTRLFPADLDTLNGIVGLEVYANDTTSEPIVQILWDFDCSEETGRTLSTIANGKTNESTSRAIHFPPQSTGRHLMTLVCGK